MENVLGAPAAIPCTSCVRVPVFLVQSGILGYCRLCNLQILRRLRLSWFESMPGSHRPVGPAGPPPRLTAAFANRPFIPNILQWLFARSLRFERSAAGVQHEPPGFALEAKNSASESPFSPVDRYAKLTGGFVVAGHSDCFKREDRGPKRTVSPGVVCHDRVSADPPNAGSMCDLHPPVRQFRRCPLESPSPVRRLPLVHRVPGRPRLDRHRRTLR